MNLQRGIIVVTSSFNGCDVQGKLYSGSNTIVSRAICESDHRRIILRVLQADFYSLGITLYKLAVGKVPFCSARPMEIIRDHIAGAITPCYVIKENFP